MTDLTFARPCTYTAPNGEQRVFAPGIHRGLSDEIAGNWFVQAHLVKDSDEPVASETAPLQHEERIKIKAALDAAEGRALGAEAERDASVMRADTLQVSLTSLQAALDAEKAAHAETTAQLESLTAPPGNEEPQTIGAFTVVRGGQGSYKVMKGAEVVADRLPKAEAEAKARELNTQA